MAGARLAPVAPRADTLNPHRRPLLCLRRWRTSKDRPAVCVSQWRVGTPVGGRLVRAGGGQVANLPLGRPSTHSGRWGLCFDIRWPSLFRPGGALARARFAFQSVGGGYDAFPGRPRGARLRDWPGWRDKASSPPLLCCPCLFWQSVQNLSPQNRPLAEIATAHQNGSSYRAHLQDRGRIRNRPEDEAPCRIGPAPRRGWFSWPRPAQDT